MPLLEFLVTFHSWLCACKYVYSALQSVFFFLQVAGKFELKGHDRVRGLSSLNMHGEDQYMPRQRRDVTYVSRLQVRQACTAVLA